jgi:hypothetical protein
MSMSALLKTLWLGTTAVLLGTCAEEPEDAGNCSLSCSNAIIGSNDPQMKIKAMTEPGNISCASAEATIQPIRLKFLAT